MIKLIILTSFIVMGCSVTSYHDCEEVSSPDKEKMAIEIQKCYSNASLDKYQKDDCVLEVKGSFCSLVIVKHGCGAKIIYSPEVKEKLKSGRTYSRRVEDVKVD